MRLTQKQLDSYIWQARQKVNCKQIIEQIAKLSAGQVLRHERAPHWAFLYACYVVEGRWLEGEWIIKKSPSVSCNYAIDVIKGRWPEAEKIIKKDPIWFNHYENMMLKVKMS